MSFLSLVFRISLVNFKQGLSLVIWYFSLSFPRICGFCSERKSLVNLRFFLGKTEKSRNGRTGFSNLGALKGTKLSQKRSRCMGIFRLYIEKVHDGFPFPALPMSSIQINDLLYVLGRDRKILSIHFQKYCRTNGGRTAVQMGGVLQGFPFFDA